VRSNDLTRSMAYEFIRRFNACACESS